MRLLVYGGNEHSERRRIGDWSTIASQVFQDTYGSSMRSASYGVGVLDQQAFLILRKIENFGQRAYPLVVLFDPGRDAWERFEWNGAHLLWALFGNVESAGINLINDPENYHSDEDLGRLLAQMDEKIMPEADREAIKSGAQLLDLWAGAASGKSPVITPVDQQVMGFNNRPDLRVLSSLVGQLPMSLRCGQGWLFGGRDNHAESFGARLVFDDGKFDPPTESEKKTLFEVTRRGAELRAALEALSGMDEVEGAGLKEYLSKPLFEWSKEGAGNLESIGDILLLKELKDSLNDGVLVKPLEINERYGRINKRLKIGSPLSEQIAAAANQLIELADRKFTTEETNFILNRHRQQQKPKRLKEKILSNINEEAAAAFFVEHRVYPADAAGSMPEAIRTEVAEKLLATEKSVANIPEAFRNEAELSPAYSEEDLQSLLEAAVTRSAEFDRGLVVWRKHLIDELIGTAVRAAVQEVALNRTQADNHNSLADYLLLADDAGGVRLAEKKPAFKEVETLGSLLVFIRDQLNTESEAGLAQKAKVWLEKLAKSELRSTLDLDDKDKITELVKQDWESYVCMRRAFRGENDPSLVPYADDQEREFLTHELREATETAWVPTYIPDVERLSLLLAPDCLGSLIRSLLHLEPDLNADAGRQWVEGWRVLSKTKTELNEDQRTTCLTKHRREFVRLMLQTDVSLRKTDHLRDLDSESLMRLFRGLLTEGETDLDGRRSHRLVEVLRDAYKSNEIRDAIQQVYEELAGHDEQKQVMVRRLVGHRPAAAAMEKKLKEEQLAEFKGLLDEKKHQERAAAKKRILEIFSAGLSDSEAYEAVLEVKRAADTTEKEIFNEALAYAFEQLLTNDQMKKLFVSGGAAGEECVKLYGKHLPELHKRWLTDLANEKTIRMCIFDGLEKHDNDYKSKLAKLVPKEYDERFRKAFNDAVLHALNDKTKTETLLRRYVPIIRTLMQQGTVLSLSTNDPLFEAMFENLSPRVGYKFLTSIWKAYGGDRPGEQHLLYEPALAAFKKLKFYVETIGKGKKKKKPTDKQWLRALDKFLLDFIDHTPSLKKQLGIGQFGADKASTIDGYLKERELKSQNDKYVESTSDEKGDSQEVSTLRRVGRGFRKLWITLPGDDEEEARQGKDQ